MAVQAQRAQSGGYNGVTLFFVLSGFVLAWNYAGRPPEGHDPRAAAGAAPAPCRGADRGLTGA